VSHFSLIERTRTTNLIVSPTTTGSAGNLISGTTTVRSTGVEATISTPVGTFTEQGCPFSARGCRRKVRSKRSKTNPSGARDDLGQAAVA
jgi:hypothetical protein